MGEKRKRTIVKTLSFRILATITTVLVVFIFTGSATISLGIGVIEFVTKPFLYYAYERVWNRIEWGIK